MRMSRTLHTAFERCLWLLAPHVAAAACADSDDRCRTTGCSQWCSRWSCTKEGCEGCGIELGCVRSPPPPHPPPHPRAPPWTKGFVPGSLNIYGGTDGLLYVNGERLNIKGANWFGSESRSGPPLGLDKHKISWYMEFLTRYNFNALRLLVRYQLEHIPAHLSSRL